MGKYNAIKAKAKLVLQRQTNGKAKVILKFTELLKGSRKIWRKNERYFEMSFT